MSSISFFEKQTRNTLAISVLNKTRRYFKGIDSEIDVDKKEIFKKVLDIFDNNNIAFTDIISYFCKDTGKTSNSVTILIFMVLNQVIDSDFVKDFVAECKKLFNENSIGEVNQSKIVKILEKTIDLIDSDIIASPTSFEVETKGF